jgi:hypothetical protein
MDSFKHREIAGAELKEDLKAMNKAWLRSRCGWHRGLVAGNDAVRLGFIRLWVVAAVRAAVGRVFGRVDTPVLQRLVGQAAVCAGAVGGLEWSDGSGVRVCVVGLRLATPRVGSGVCAYGLWLCV